MVSRRGECEGIMGCRLWLKKGEWKRGVRWNRKIDGVMWGIMNLGGNGERIVGEVVGNTGSKLIRIVVDMRGF